MDEWMCFSVCACACACCMCDAGMNMIALGDQPIRLADANQQMFIARFTLHTFRTLSLSPHFQMPIQFESLTYRILNG